MKSCHLTLPPLEKISRILKAKYNGANEVFPSLRENKKSLYLLNRARFRNRQSGNRPKKSALVFLVKSQYCYRQDEYRILGTQGRLCRRNTNKEDDCIFLCCGRGYSRNVSHKKRFCNCKKGPSAPCSCKLCTDVVIENKCLWWYCWQCTFYEVTWGLPHQQQQPNKENIVSKTYMAERAIKSRN